MKSKTKSDSSWTQSNKEMCENISHSEFMNSQQTAIGMECVCVWMCARGIWYTNVILYNALDARHSIYNRPAHMFCVCRWIYSNFWVSLSRTMCSFFCNNRKEQLNKTNRKDAHTNTKSKWIRFVHWVVARNKINRPNNNNKNMCTMRWERIVCSWLTR